MIINVSDERLLVVSDLHLGNPASQAAAAFRAFLEYVRVEGFSLCLNGDAFEMLQTRFSLLLREALPLMTQISRLRREGRRVYYVVGNHDIYLEHFLDDWLVTGISPFLNVTSGGKRIRIEHGHLYDPIFSRWPDVYESLTWLSGHLLLARPDAYRAWDGAARALHQLRHWGARTPESRSPQHAAATQVLRRGFDAVIYGHTHHPETTQLTGGLYVNRGDWLHDATYVEIVAGRVTLKTWPPGAGDTPGPTTGAATGSSGP